MVTQIGCVTYIDLIWKFDPHRPDFYFWLNSNYRSSTYKESTHTHTLLITKHTFSPGTLVPRLAACADDLFGLAVEALVTLLVALADVRAPLALRAGRALHLTPQAVVAGLALLSVGDIL